MSNSPRNVSGPFQLMTNQFSLKFTQNMIVYQYHIDFIGCPEDPFLHDKIMDFTQGRL